MKSENGIIERIAKWQAHVDGQEQFSPNVSNGEALAIITELEWVLDKKNDN